MNTIEELLTTPQVDEEVWELDNRYEVNLAYSDDQGPVEVVGKNIGSMSNQISIQGESMSQYLEFMMPRYYDNIDLSDKTITIHYEMNGAGGEITPINMYRSQDKIKFGWVIPATASQTFGNLSIGIWARGYVNAEEYIWKSRTASYTIEKGLMIGGGIPEPDENWYLEFVRQMDVRVSEASLYASRAKQSEGSASSSESAARGFMEEARTGASTAIQKAGEALNSASTASNASITAQESATLAMEYRDGAEEYYERTKGISEGLSGQLVPMGTVTFENLPALEDAVSGWMYNISNEFTTTSQFKEGAGKVIPLGSNVYKTTDGYWDVLAGSPVSGVKGSAEATYRSGNVNITPANLGITVVNNTKDENKNVNHSKTSDSTTKAAQDSNGNVIADTYASKSEASLSGTATGTNPTIQDSTNAPLVSLKVKGKTEQFTTSGKNLCSSNNFTVTAPASGTPQSNYIYKSINIHNKITSNKTYIFSADIKKLVGSPSEISIVFMNEALSTGTEIKTGTITNNHVEISISIGNASVYYYLLVYAGKQGSTAGNSIEFSNVMLRESTSSAEYEPFTNGASPNPEYPQEINGLAKDGAIEVKTCGKNLLKNTATTQTVSGVTFTVNDDKSITANGTATGEIYISVGDFKPKPNKAYIFTSNSKTLSNSEYWRAFSYIANIDGVDTWRSDSPNNNYSYEFTPLTDTTIFNTIYIESGMTVNNLKFYPMIRPAEIADDTYEPYTETTATIPTDAPLYEGDYLEIFADGSGKVVRKKHHISVSRSEFTKTINATTRVEYYQTEWKYPADKYGTTNDKTEYVKCNLTNEIKNPDSTSQTTESWIASSGSKSTIRISSSIYNVLSDENKLEMVYELATPTETPLTAEQVAEFKKLYTFEPTTNVFCEGETEIQYYKNSDNGKVAGMLQRQIDSITSTLSSTEEVSDEYRNNLS